MKRFFLLLFLPLALNAQKQKVTWEHDTIYTDAKPYAIMTSTGGLEPVYSIRTLTNKEIALASLDDAISTTQDGSTRYPYYKVNFIASGNIGDFSNSLGMGKRLSKAIVENDLVHDSVINPEGEKRFLMLYPKKQPTNSQQVIINVNNGTNYTMVDRNRNMMVFATAGNITQDGKTIGTYKENSGSGYEMTTTISFYLPNGTKVAEATYSGAIPKDCRLTTFRDNATRSITFKNSAVKEDELSQWLVDNNYL